MKKYTCILLLMICTIVFGQNNDQSVKFDVNDSLAVSLEEPNTTNLERQSIKSDTLKNPLKNFLDSPIQSLVIQSGNQGCYGGEDYSVVYLAKNKSLLKAKNYFYDKTKKNRFKKAMDTHKLVELLHYINIFPSVIPSIEDFNITEKDKKNYLAMMDENSKYYDEFFDQNSNTSSVNVLEQIDTLDKSVLEQIFNNNDDTEYWSTFNTWFNITIINQDNDTLNISRNEFSNSYSWNLPWKFEFNGIYFNCYDINFSKFIRDCTPDRFTGKLFFDNKYLLNDIANYLYWNE